MEKAHPRYLRPGRPISVSVVPFGPGIDIWRSWSFYWVYYEVSLPVCLGGFAGLFLALLVLIIVGFVILVGKSVVMVSLLDHVRVLFLNELLSLFRYPSRSGRALLNGTLPLRYCAVRFAHSTPDLAVTSFWSGQSFGCCLSWFWLVIVVVRSLH